MEYFDYEQFRNKFIHKPSVRTVQYWFKKGWMPKPIRMGRKSFFTREHLKYVAVHLLGKRIQNGMKGKK